MTQARNILFVLCDQLRWDYLSCYSQPQQQLRFSKVFHKILIGYWEE